MSSRHEDKLQLKAIAISIEDNLSAKSVITIYLPVVEKWESVISVILGMGPRQMRIQN